MSIQIDKQSDNYLQFTISNSNSLSKPIDEAFCNALRRIMISEVKTFAIEIVSITKNNTILIDGILSHRLGLIPIKILKPEEFNNSYNISLNVSYDNNKADIYGIQNIYSSDLIYDKTMIEIDPNILLVVLKENQEVELNAIIKEGIGQEHTKWSPVCPATFVLNENGSFTFKIETVGQKSPEQVFIEAIEIMQNKLLSCIK